MEGLVTVVIPIYNVEKYLDRCISSIIDQSYRNLEILLIDDGSPDGCPQMCDQWAKKDDRIKVIHKQNAGLGMARNTGIEHASGEYICFFDSDDYVDSDTIRLAYELAHREKADVVLFGMTRINSKGEVLKRVVPSTPQDIYSGNDVQEKLLPCVLSDNPDTGESYGLPLSACSMLFSVDLIHRTQWHFVSEREFISEDTYSLLAIYQDIRKAAILRYPLYFYCVNSTSLTQIYREDRYKLNRYCYEQCVALCHQCGYTAEVILACAGPFMGNTFQAMKQAVSFTPHFREAKRHIRRIIDDETLQHVLHNKKRGKMNRKITVMVWAMRHKLYSLCYILLLMQNTVDGSRKS